MAGLSEPAISWAQGVTRELGRMELLPEVSQHSVWVVPFSQAELARRDGLSAGTVASYLTQLGDVVLRRQPVVVLDVPGLVELSVQLDRARADLPQRTLEIAWRLARRLGQPDPRFAGTVLLSQRYAGRPASVAEMARAAELTVRNLGSHLARLEAAGRLVRRDRFWVMPPMLTDFANKVREPAIAAALGDLVHVLVASTSQLSELAAASEELREVANDVDVAAFSDRLERLYEHAADLLIECGVDPLTGRADPPMRANDRG